MKIDFVVIDVNDNKPLFDDMPSQIAAPYPSGDTSRHAELWNVAASDRDMDLNGMVRYGLVDCPPALSIDHYTGKFRIQKLAARRLREPITCQITAFDLGTDVILRHTVYKK